MISEAPPPSPLFLLFFLIEELHIAISLAIYFSFPVLFSHLNLCLFHVQHCWQPNPSQLFSRTLSYPAFTYVCIHLLWAFFYSKQPAPMISFSLPVLFDVYVSDRGMGRTPPPLLCYLLSPEIHIPSIYFPS